MQLLRWWNIPRRGWIIILGELAIIIGLAAGVYSEYLNNAYFQSYVNSLSPVLVPIVSVGFGIASATVATLLYFTMRNIRHREAPTDKNPAQRRMGVKKTVNKSESSTSRSERTVGAAQPIVPRQRGLFGGTSGTRRPSPQDREDEDDESR